MSSTQPLSCAQLPLCRQGTCLCHLELVLVSDELLKSKNSPYYHDASRVDEIGDSPDVVAEKEAQLMDRNRERQKEDVAALTMARLPEKIIQQETDAASSTLVLLKYS